MAGHGGAVAELPPIDLAQHFRVVPAHCPPQRGEKDSVGEPLHLTPSAIISTTSANPGPAHGHSAPGTSTVRLSATHVATARFLTVGVFTLG